MATITKFANATTNITTGWTNPTNVYADDSVYATAAPGKNADIISEFGFPGFTTAEIPDGSTINSVTLEAQYKSSTTGSTGALLGVNSNDGGVLGVEQTVAMVLADTLVDFAASVTLADLRSNNNVRMRLRAHRGSSNTAVTWSVDYVKITVDYTVDTTPPTTAILTSLTGKISRVTGMDSFTVNFSVSETIQAYDIRLVPSAASLHTDGTSIKTGVPFIGGNVNESINDFQLEAAGGVVGDNIVKVFVQDLAGNWSS